MGESIPQLIEGFKRLKVLVIGDAILDAYVRGVQERFCREAPVPVFNVLSHEYQCGGAANTAINAALLGATTYFVTVLGKDMYGKELEEVLKRHKVHTEGIVRDKTRITTVKQRITSDASILLRIDEGSKAPVSATCVAALLAKITTLLPRVDAVILSDYGYGVCTDALLSGLQPLLVNSGKPLIADAKDLKRYRPFAPAAVKPNYEEMMGLLQLPHETGSRRITQVQEAADRLLALTGAQQVAATLDADGVLFLQKNKPAVHIPCVASKNNKAIGAGDTFVSAMALALAGGAAGRTAVEVAAAAAAVVVQKEGTSGCTYYELKNMFAPVPKYITTVTDLELMVKELRAAGRHIVFTNGCFDILHKGHISLLQQAKEAGDVLIVGVNSDASIRQLKGADRPVNNFEDRITVLAGLQSVDYIIAFDEQSPLRLIRKIRPDVFVKGGNYSEASIPELPLLQQLNCSIKIVPYVVDHSTSQLIRRIRSVEPGIKNYPAVYTA